MIKWAVLFIVFFLAGCSTLPDSLQMANESNLVTYPEVASSPEANADKLARWGGVIAHIENQADSTLVEMVHFPLRSYGRPSTSNESIGRFRVYVDGFLDPMVFKAGRSITFNGQVIGIEDGQVGEQQYRFPAIQASAYHLWQDIETVDIRGIDVWPYHHWHRWPYYHHTYPYRQRAVIRKNDYHGGKKVSTKSVKSSDPSRSVNIASRHSVERRAEQK